MRTIALVREPDASDERVREVYRDVKDSLRVSFVDALFQAFAAEPKFLDHVWRRLRPNMLTPPFLQSAAEIGALAASGVAGWPVGDHAAALRARNYGDDDLRRLGDIVAVFESIDPKLLIVAHAVRASLRGEQVGGGGVPHAHVHVERDRLVPDRRGFRVPFAEEGEAPLRVRATYDEIQRATGMPLIANVHRAMGAYPDWLDVLWSDVKPVLLDPRRRRLCELLGAAADDAVRRLPYPLTVPAVVPDEMAEVDEAFCALLPCLIADVAVARRGLGGPKAAG